MEEKRGYKRLNLDVTMEMERLDEDDRQDLKYIHVTVTDISRSGIGFTAKKKLDVNSSYNSKVQIWTKEVLDVIIHIVRRQQLSDGNYKYGGRFIGMTDADAMKIDIFQIFNDV